jgi:hypothetical protein
MSYNPIKLVDEVHRFPHFNGKLKVVSNAFAIFNNSYWNSYSQSLLPLSIIIACIGGLAVLCLLTSLCMRRCVECCKCEPKQTSATEDSEHNAKLLKSNRISMRGLSIAIVIAAVLTIASDQSVFFGNRSLDSAVSTGNDALNFLTNSFNALEDDGDTLLVVGNYLLANASAADNNGCSAAGDAIPEISQFNNDINSYLQFIDPVPGYISTAKGSLDRYGVRKKNAIVWSLYSVVFVVAFGFLLGLYCQGKLCLQYNIFFSISLICVLIALCAAEMIIMVSLFACQILVVHGL